MLVANHSGRVEFHHASEYLGSNIGAARMITEIFSEKFFPPVWSCKTRVNRHVWNREPLNKVVLSL
jgi:hypothetical protein